MANTRLSIKQVTASATDALVNALNAPDSERLNEFLRITRCMHNYSVANQLWLYAQGLQRRSKPTVLHTYKRWQALGRNVLKGSESYKIWCPRPYEDKASGERKMFFAVGSVFDVSQTEGELISPCELDDVNGNETVYLQRFESYLKDQNIPLHYEDLHDLHHGSTDGTYIRINSNLSDAGKLSTMAHELCHLRLHFGDDRKDLSKTVAESEAECLAYLACHAMGIDSLDKASNYLKLYQVSPAVVTSSVPKVVGVLREVIQNVVEVGTFSKQEVLESVA